MKPAKKRKIERKAVKEGKNVNFEPEVTNKPLVKIASGLRPRIVNAAELEAKLAPVPKPVPRPAAKKAAAIQNAVAKPGGEEPEFEIKKTKIRIIGIGGGGGNIVSEIAEKVKKSSFYIANTDFAALRHAPKQVTVFQFGENMTHGLGTGMDPRLAEEAATAEREAIKKIVEDQDLVVIVASLGGGTGSGAAPVFAQVSKSLGNLTYGIFTMPFVFEGTKKSDIAKASLERLKPYLNAFTLLPNERVFEVVPKSTPFSKTLSFINTMLSDSLEGLIETIYDIGLINIDFADLRTVLAGNGKVAFLNTVTFKKGEEANLDSFDKVFGSPLYPYTIDKARGLLLNIVAQKDLKLLEVNKILTSVASRIHRDARIIFGIGHEGAPEGAVRVTVLATGCVYGDAGDANGNAAVPVPVPKPKTAKIMEPPKPARGAKKKKLTAKKPVPAAKPKKVTVRAAKDAKNKKKIEIKKATGAKTEKVTVAPRPAGGSVSEKPAGPIVPAADPASYQSQQSIADQFSPPIRRNALQVKKEIEMEEKQMLEKEKEWDVPAFLRKKK
jgi:cell division protein FtsZ